MYLREIGWGMSRILLVQGEGQQRVLVITTLRLRIPWNSVKFICGWETDGLKRGLSSTDLVR
jgi:hypothetical protein